jgi:hypothetical protein
MVDVLFIVSSGAAPAMRAQAFRLPVFTGHGTVLVSYSFPELLPNPAFDRPTELVIGGAQQLPLTRITSVDLMARRSLKDDMPSIMLRATIRATTSAVLQSQGQQHSNRDADAVAAIAGLALSAFLQGADDRTWRSLPGDVSIARARLPPGVHDITLKTPTGEQRARVSVSGSHAVIDFRALSQQLFVQAPKAALPGSDAKP